MSITSYSVSVVRKIVWVPLIMSVLAGTLIFASRNLSDNRQRDDGETKYLASQQRHTLLESEVITVTRRGFEPALITRPEGRFILMVDNRSGKDLNFRLSRDTGQPLTEIASKLKSLRSDHRQQRLVHRLRVRLEWQCDTED